MWATNRALMRKFVNLRANHVNLSSVLHSLRELKQERLLTLSARHSQGIWIQGTYYKRRVFISPKAHNDVQLLKTHVNVH